MGAMRRNWLPEATVGHRYHRGHGGICHHTSRRRSGARVLPRRGHEPLAARQHVAIVRPLPVGALHYRIAPRPRSPRSFNWLPARARDMA